MTPSLRPRLAAAVLLALGLAACAPPGGGSSSGSAPPPGGVVVVTAGGTALTDGSDDVPPTFDLAVAGDGLTAGNVGARLDGTRLTLAAAPGGVRCSVAAMPLGSPHRLDLAIAGRPAQTIGFRIVGLTGVSAAAWSDGGRPVVDVVFERAPGRPELAGAFAGAQAAWADATHVRLTWASTPPAAITLPADVPADRGSRTAGPLTLQLTGIAPGTLRRSTVPAATAPRSLKLVAWAGPTDASRASTRDHVAALTALAPTGWHATADGGLTGGPDASEMAAAASAGVPVWPLVANDFGDPDGTARLLDDDAASGRLVTALAAAVHRLGAQGLNLDFEVIPEDHAGRFTQFATRLAAALHAEGAQLSVDVVPHRPGQVTSYTAGYDIPALGRVADLVVIMCYDQHASAGEPGPVGGLDWQSEVLSASMDGLDPHKVLLGVPLYARTWTGDGSPVADSYGHAIATALAWPGVRYDYDFDAASPLLRADASEAQAWFDDADSLVRKVAAVQRLGLAGAAAWRLGFEDPAVWSTLV